MSVEHTEEIAVAKGMPRRVIVKSAAWSLPVLTAVSVTPAFASSTPITSTGLTASRTKKLVTFRWSFTLGPGVTITNVTPNAVAQFTFPGPAASGNPWVFTGENQTGTNDIPTFNFVVNYTQGSASGRMTFTVVGQAVPDDQQPIPVSVS